LVRDTTSCGIRTNVIGPTATDGYLHLYRGDIVIGTTSGTINASKSTIIISERCSLTTSLLIGGSSAVGSRYYFMELIQNQLKWLYAYVTGLCPVCLFICLFCFVFRINEKPREQSM